ALVLSLVAGPVWWSAYYDKLWILPFAFALLLLATALAWNRQRSPRFVSWASAVCLALVLLMAVTNVRVAVERHGSDDPSRAPAREMAAMFGDRDLIIGGW